MSRMRYNKAKFRYEGRTRDGRDFAVDEDMMAQYQLDNWKGGGARFPASLLESRQWEPRIGGDAYFIDLLDEQLTEIEQKQSRAARLRSEKEARKNKRAEIKAYLLAHPTARNDRTVAATLETTHIQVRHVRQDIAKEAQA